MKKITFAVVLIVLVAGILLYIDTQLDGIVAGLIEEHGSAATQTPVRVDGVTIDLSAANGTISNLAVGNPEGFSGNAIEMEGFSLTLDAASLTSDTIIIENLLVSGARLNILQQAKGNNLQQLMKNLGASQSGSNNDSADSGKKLIINRFTLDGASASVSIPDIDEVREVALPTVVVSDVGRATNGVTGAQVAQQLLQPVINQALKSVAVQGLRDQAAEKFEEVADKVLDGLSGVFGGSEETE